MNSHFDEIRGYVCNQATPEVSHLRAYLFIMQCTDFEEKSIKHRLLQKT